ncbi:ABC transporter ATP-binding protein [Nitriliruptoraceae bacterium ZYF776]|nr:ABC transporter ATP-binding protein [Profundirhabdus halotolerans]
MRDGLRHLGRGGPHVNKVAIAGLRKSFGDFQALKGIDLDIRDGEFLTLLGPSGCGKTTTLRCLAGLEAPSEGSITVDGEVFACAEQGRFVPPEKRSVGMVFQSYALWPHMTVRSNVGYPLKLAKQPREQIRERVAEILRRIGLEDRMEEMATALSGGQQQRVALARALVARPSLVLFDEPLSNLDAKLRYGMRNEIRSLHDTYGMTSVYVTHDQEEAIALSDRIVVMNLGRIVQIGAPKELYTRPNSRFVADFMGFQNLLDGTITAVAGGEFTVEVAGRDFHLRGEAPGVVGEAAVVAFRASHVRAGAGEGTRLRGTVRHETYLGSSVRMLVDLGDELVRTELSEVEVAALGDDLPGVGEEVELTVPVGRALGLPGDGAAGRAARPPEPAVTR